MTERHYPEMPPALEGETDAQYTDRLTGADQTGRVPYDHRRNRQCSIGYHDECSDPAGERCECPCHRQVPEIPPIPYDSRPDTFKHSLRVGELVGEVVTELVQRMTQHDISKTEQPELEVFDRVTPELAYLEYGSPEYKASLDSMGDALQHHYANNPHHPEFHGSDGVEGMTLVDLVEMLADWKAAGERHSDGDLAKSLEIQKGRFDLEQIDLSVILWNTAKELGWLD